MAAPPPLASNGPILADCEPAAAPSRFFVPGWLGGYNFQWAWASGWAGGQVT